MTLLFWDELRLFIFLLGVMGSFLVFGPLLEIITTEKISMDTLPTLAVAKNPDEIKRK